MLNRGLPFARKLMCSPIIDAYFTSSRVLNMHSQSTLIHGVSLYLHVFHGFCDANWLTQWLCLWVQLFFNWLLRDIYIHPSYYSVACRYFSWWGNEWKCSASQFWNIRCSSMSAVPKAHFDIAYENAQQISQTHRFYSIDTGQMCTKKQNIPQHI